MQATLSSRSGWMLMIFVLICVLGSPGVMANTPASAVRPDVSTQVSAFLQQLEGTADQIRNALEQVDTVPLEEWFDGSLKAEAEAEIENSAETGDAAHQRWLQALENERLAAERLSGAQQRLRELESYAERFKVWQQRLTELLALRTQWAEEEPGLSQLEALITEMRGRQQQLVLELDQKRSSLQRLEDQARTQTETLDQLVQEPRPEAVELTEDPGNVRLSEAIEALVESAQRRHEARLLAARLDQVLLQPRIRVLRLEIEAAELESALLTSAQQWLEAEFNARSTQELRDLNTALTRLLEREPDLAVQFSQEVQEMRSRLDSVAQQYERLRVLQEQRADYERWIGELTHSLSAVEERLEIGGLTEAVGTQFLDEQKRLEEYGDPRVTLQVLERELAQSRLRSISLRDDLRRLRQLPEMTAVVGDLQELVRIGTELLNLQMQSEQQLTEQLRQNEYRLRQVSELAGRLEQILRETLLWWPSHGPVNRAWFNRFTDASASLLAPAAWQGMYQSIVASVIGAPISSLLILILVGGLYAWGRQTDAHLREIAEQTTHKYTDNIGLTVKAMGWSLVRVLPVPVLLYGLSWLLLQDSITSGIETLSYVLSASAGWWLAGHLFLIFTREQGVGRAHFEWNPLILSRMRRNLIWFLPVQLVLIILVALTYGHPDDLVYDVFGRLGLVLIILLNQLIAWRILAPAGEDQGAFFQSLKRRLLRFGFVFVSVTALLLTLAGYLLTVSELLPRFVDTLVVFSLVLLLYSLAVRALVLSETRLRIRRMKEQRAREALEAASSESEGATDLPEPHLSIEDIGQQTQTLLKTSVFTGLLIALFMVWADVLPALNWLDNVTLWSRTIVLGETEILSRVSLQDVLLALLLGAFFVIANRNLPGLIEILLSRSHLVDQVHSYTVTTLVRYAITVVAVVSIFSLLGLRWSELQWMVAALTLGLGFGLQEVVANFVSGLIMLFERPVRVGDTITIGEYSGTVARIRTRATTIIDWDNREIVVPNKNFITERLINWTLSDNTTRIVIPVGVSYDSDPEEVMSLLLEIANNHPLTLKDPAPNVYFLNFADSSLSFELRVYVCQMKDRMVTTSELHVQILKAFRKAGIEIAFPQLDLHIRDLPEGRVSR